jgi:hypothetical protein
MDGMIEYLGAMTLGAISVPLALWLAWISLRCVFDMMPAASGVQARVAGPVRRRATAFTLGGRTVLRGAPITARHQ